MYLQNVSTVGMINHESGRFCETSYLCFGNPET